MYTFFDGTVSVKQLECHSAVLLLQIPLTLEWRVWCLVQVTLPFPLLAQNSIVPSPSSWFVIGVHTLVLLLAEICLGRRTGD